MRRADPASPARRRSRPWVGTSCEASPRLGPTSTAAGRDVAGGQSYLAASPFVNVRLVPIPFPDLPDGVQGNVLGAITNRLCDGWISFDCKPGRTQKHFRQTFLIAIGLRARSSLRTQRAEVEGMRFHAPIENQSVDDRLHPRQSR